MDKTKKKHQISNTVIKNKNIISIFQSNAEETLMQKLSFWGIMDNYYSLFKNKSSIKFIKY